LLGAPGESAFVAIRASTTVTITTDNAATPWTNLPREWSCAWTLKRCCIGPAPDARMYRRSGSEQ